MYTETRRTVATCPASPNTNDILPVLARPRNYRGVSSRLKILMPFVTTAPKRLANAVLCRSTHDRLHAQTFQEPSQILLFHLHHAVFEAVDPYPRTCFCNHLLKRSSEPVQTITFTTLLLSLRLFV